MKPNRKEFLEKFGEDAEQINYKGFILIDKGFGEFRIACFDPYTDEYVTSFTDFSGAYWAIDEGYYSL